MKGPVHRLAAVLAVFMALGAGTVGCATSGKRVAQAPELAESRRGVMHVVEPGQTLWRIAKAYGVPLEELAEVNGIDDPTELKSGRSLFIPRATAAIDVPPYRPLVPTATTFAWPVPGGRILSGYGAARKSHRHAGLDIAGRPGQEVLAAQSGRVVYSGSSLNGYGKTVILDHGEDTRTLYAHNSSLLVAKGQWVERGQTIARVGRTGNASADHCHFEVRRNDVAVDPLPYLPRREGRVP